MASSSLETAKAGAATSARRQKLYKALVISVPYLWLLAFFLAPFLIVMKISLVEVRVAMPPYSELITFVEDGWIAFHGSLENYLWLWDDPLYINS